jgi:hypothetical protein
MNEIFSNTLKLLSQEQSIIDNESDEKQKCIAAIENLEKAKISLNQDSQLMNLINNIEQKQRFETSKQFILSMIDEKKRLIEIQFDLIQNLNQNRNDNDNSIINNNNSISNNKNKSKSICIGNENAKKALIDGI